MKNKIALITGANSGIGLETAKALALANYDLILIVRSQQKGTETTALIRKINTNINVDVYVADLGNLNSVNTVAIEIGKKYSIIDRIICNAGYGPHVIEYNNSGFEQSFVTNYLAHFILVNTLLQQVEAAHDGRVIHVASSAYKLGKVERMFQKQNKQLTALQAYGDGKLANVLFNKALAKKLTNAVSFSLHPGVVKSGFGANYTGFFKFMATLMRPFMISTVKGAQTTIYLATTALENIKKYNGAYFEKSAAIDIKFKEVTDANAEWLWEKSKEVVGL
jgi:retinol dehydrogenase 12